MAAVALLVLVSCTAADEPAPDAGRGTSSPSTAGQVGGQPGPEVAREVGPEVGLEVGEVPVWYDDAGLHRGDVVEQTAVPLRSREPGPSVLTLVRRGALYLDPARDEVWFHPWGGEPRVVGHHAPDGPAGDPGGDVAAWFEGGRWQGWDLVVYDTARGRELARVESAPLPMPYTVRDVVGGANAFREVSARAVVWETRAADGALRRWDLRTEDLTVLPTSPRGQLEDLHGGTLVWRQFARPAGLAIRVSGRPDQSLPDFRPLAGRLSPDGRFLVADAAGDGRSVRFVDVGAGADFAPPGAGRSRTSWVAWSYGSTAMLLAGRDVATSPLVTCDAEVRRCRRLPHVGAVVLPSS